MVTLLSATRRWVSPHNLMALPMACGIAFAMLLAAPAEWFLTVHSIRIVQTDDRRTAVIQARTVWPGDALQVAWVAQIDRIDGDSDGRGIGQTVCQGGGLTVIRDDDFEIIKMPLADWVGDPGCSPEQGVAHVAHASWTFTVLGITKTATQRSAAFVRPDAEVALGG